MDMNRLLLGTMAAGMIPLGSASAAVVAVGTDTTTGANWRTAAALEADNEYGSDGYVIYGIDAADNAFSPVYAFDMDQTALPAGINGIATNATRMFSGAGNFGTMEDPGNGNALTNTPLLVAAVGLSTSTFTISRNPNTSFRLTLLAASGDGSNVTHNTDVNDGSGAISQSTTHTADGLYYHVYDISAGSSDVVVNVQVPTGGATHFSLTGLAFDNVVPEPSSLALIGLGGLCVLRRRRN